MTIQQQNLFSFFSFPSFSTTLMAPPIGSGPLMSLPFTFVIVRAGNCGLVWVFIIIGEGEGCKYDTLESLQNQAQNDSTYSWYFAVPSVVLLRFLSDRSFRRSLQWPFASLLFILFFFLRLPPPIKVDPILNL